MVYTAVTMRDDCALWPGYEIRLVADSIWRGHLPGADHGDPECLQIWVF